MNLKKLGKNMMKEKRKEGKKGDKIKIKGGKRFIFPRYDFFGKYISLYWIVTCFQTDEPNILNMKK